MDIIFLFSILGGIVVYYFYITRNYNYWSKQGIPCPKGVLPGIGHMWPVLSLKMSFSDFIQRSYESCSNQSMVGFYHKTAPALIVCEPELVKIVMQTNFTSFSANQLKIDPRLDSLLALNAFFSQGDVWITSRKRLIHAFSAVRLKISFDYVNRVCKKFEDYIDQRLKKNDVMEVELKELLSRYTGEVVANVGFGLEGCCFEDQPHPASFCEIIKSFMKPNFLLQIVLTLNFFLPELNKIFRIPFVPRQVDRFFRNIVKRNVQIRRQEEVVRNDVFQLMMDMEKIETQEFDETSLTAHMFSFFLDGYETTSITLSFIVYQLARHPYVQQKLRNEIETTFARYDGCMTYESLKEMPYMEQVISESQRLYTAVGTLGKICTEEIELKGSDGLRCRLKHGMEVIVPVYALHRDRKYWHNPDTFDPERFNADRKTEIQKHIFLPFGQGPRICVGMRMALLLLKTCLSILIKKYSFEISPKTQDPLKMSSGNFLSVPVGGLWVYIKHL